MSKGVDNMKINNVDIKFIIEDFINSEFFDLPSPLNANLDKYLKKNDIDLSKQEYDTLIVTIREKL
jgi:hypothetical protein